MRKCGRQENKHSTRRSDPWEGPAQDLTRKKGSTNLKGGESYTRRKNGRAGAGSKKIKVKHRIKCRIIIRTWLAPWGKGKFRN